MTASRLNGRRVSGERPPTGPTNPPTTKPRASPLHMLGRTITVGPMLCSVRGRLCARPR